MRVAVCLIGERTPAPADGRPGSGGSRASRLGSSPSVALGTIGSSRSTTRKTIRRRRCRREPRIIDYTRRHQQRPRFGTIPNRWKCHEVMRHRSCQAGVEDTRGSDVTPRVQDTAARNATRAPRRDQDESIGDHQNTESDDTKTGWRQDDIRHRRGETSATADMLRGGWRRSAPQ